MVDTNMASITLWYKPYKFLISDIELLSADSIIQKYNIESLFDQMSFKQVHKLSKDPKSLIFKMISNLTWMMLLLIPSLALVFKLLYIRRKKYYVEHLVFLFHVHAFILLVGAMALVLKYAFEISFRSDLLIGLLVILLFYILFASKKVYEQGWIKTLIKSFFIFVAYFILFIICLVIISMVSFFLF